MSATRLYCKGQIIRLSACRGFKDFEEFPQAIQELVNVMAEHALCDEHAKAAIDSWLAEYPNCPAPSELRNILGATARPEWEQPEEQIGCPKCDGTGWRISRKGDYEYAVPCACRGGM